MMSVTHEDIDMRLANGEQRFSKIEEGLAKLLTAVEPIPRMAEQISETRELVEAWQAVKIGGKFLKWAAGTIAVVAGAAVAVSKAMATAILAFVR
jgi:hypothetical protein